MQEFSFVVYGTNNFIIEKRKKNERVQPALLRPLIFFTSACVLVMTCLGCAQIHKRKNEAFGFLSLFVQS